MRFCAFKKANFHNELLKQWRDYGLYVAIISLCVGLFLLPFWGIVSPKIPINLIYGAFAICVIAYWRDLGAINKIRFPLFALMIVIIMAFISLYFASDINATISAIRQYLLEPSLFMICAFLLVRRSLESRARFNVFFALLCVVLYFAPLASIYDFFANGGGHLGYRAMLPHYHAPQTVYSFYLLFPYAIGLYFSLNARGALRMLFLGLFALSLFSIICNGGRFIMLSALVMAFAGLLFSHFRYKKLICYLALLAIIACAVWLYSTSSSNQARYNFFNMINHFSSVWETPPAKMGAFTNNECKSFAKCLPYTYEGQTQMDYSYISRLSMLKSTLLAISQNPFVPNGYHFQQFPYNIKRIFPLDSPNHPYSLKSTQNGELIANHAHNHNYVVSVLFELGIVGFVAFGAFVGSIIYRAYRLDSKTFGANLARGIAIGIIGLIVCNFFDCIPIRDGQILLFILCGILLGICAKSALSQDSKTN